MDRLLWADAETTGLKYKVHDSVLEFAWAVTDMELNLLGPIRKVMTEWRPPTARTLHRALPGDPEWLGGPSAPLDVVRDMHRISGLTAAWPSRVHVSAVAVQDLILNDLGITGDGTGAVHLAGAGVSHFDQGLIALHMPLLAPKDDGGRLHYRCFDTSVAALVMGTTVAGALAEFHGPNGTHVGTDCGCLKVRGAVPVTDDLLDLSLLTEHRAASDVAWGLASARAMRAKVGLDSPIQLG